MSEHAHYTTQTMGNGIWRITEDDVYMYLVEGDHSALLIDTGFGHGKLAELVASLTTLPVIVVNTHVHPDHEGGNDQFARVHLHSADMHLSQFRTGPCRLVQVGEGYIFHLGGRALMVLENPGHTPGSISLWDAQAGILFSGDSLGANTHWLFLEESLPLHVFRDSLRQFSNMADRIHAIYPAHDLTPIHADYIQDLLLCVNEILADPGVGVPYHSFTGSALCHRVGRAAIAYDPAKAI